VTPVVRRSTSSTRSPTAGGPRYPSSGISPASASPTRRVRSTAGSSPWRSWRWPRGTPCSSSTRSSCGRNQAWRYL
jgi:hypothetical protein